MQNNLLEYKLDLIAAALNVYKIEDVETVIRRQHVRPDDGRIVDVIDFYPAWNAFGTFGKMKICHEYLDDDWQRQRFEKYAGVVVDDLPVYDGQTALVRRFGQTHRCETAVRPFRLMVQPRTDDNGNNAKTLILRYLTSPKARQGQPAPPPSSPTPAPQPPAKKELVVTPDEWLARALQATDAYDFDECVSRGLAYYESGAHAEKARNALFGRWVDGRAAAYLTGLKTYASARQKLDKSGRPSRDVYNEAKADAVKAYQDAIPNA